MDKFSESYAMTSQTLGEGAKGTVFLGTRLLDGKGVAVKKVSEKATRYAELRGERVPLEVTLLGRLSSPPLSPLVIRMLDYYRVDGGWLIVTEKPEESQDLFDYITKRRFLDEGSARDFFSQVVRALRHCHDRGVVHMDLKDENLVVDMKTGRLKHVDFSSGDFLNVDKVYSAFCGMTPYAPPEWVSPGRYGALASETWSLGILLHVMVQGDVPFRDEYDILRGKLSLKKSLSQACIELIKWCLNQKHEGRPSLQEILDHPWMRQDEHGAACSTASSASAQHGEPSASRGEMDL